MAEGAGRLEWLMVPEEPEGQELLSRMAGQSEGLEVEKWQELPRWRGPWSQARSGVSGRRSGVAPEGWSSRAGRRSD